MQENYLTLGIIVLVLFTGYLAAVSFFKRDPVKDRLKKIAPMTNEGAIYEETRSGFGVLCENILSAFGVNLAQAKKDNYLLLSRAGLGSTDSVAFYMAFRYIGQPILLALGIFQLVVIMVNFSDLTKGGIAQHAILALVFIIGGGMGANLYLKNRTQKRAVVLQRSFPDMLDLLLVCIEAGLALDAALARVCGELGRAHPEITKEFDRTRLELTMLNDRPQALVNLAERTDLVQFRSLVASLIQSEKFGTNLADTLRVLADDYRTTRLLNAENKAARIPALVTVPLILCILPSLMMILLGPPFIRINEQGGLFGGQQPPPPPPK